MKQTIILSTMGQLYPTKFLPYMTNSELVNQIAGRENKITPLGQRQQFLVGSELRRRYISEDGLLGADKYVVGELYLLAPQFGPGIQSVQAQSMGLYPANNQNDLTEWQQGNAVPPIEGADFSQWQAELGEKALPFGLNTFPINQYGRAADYILSLDEHNCPYFNENWQQQVASINTTWVDFVNANGDATTQQIIQGSTIQEVCDFTQWAWVSYVDLNSQDSFEWLRTNVCEGFFQQMNEAQASLSMQMDNVVSNGFMGYVDTALSSNDHLYHSMVPIDSYHMYTLTQAISADQIDSAYVAPASVLMINEYSDKTIRTFFNDVEVTPIGCTADQPCSKSDFKGALKAKIGQVDVPSYCNSNTTN
jgi:hypothetical protein